jgi:hypothetical protein
LRLILFPVDDMGRQGGAPVARERWIDGWEAPALTRRLLVVVLAGEGVRRALWRLGSGSNVDAGLERGRGRGVLDSKGPGTRVDCLLTQKLANRAVVRSRPQDETMLQEVSLRQESDQLTGPACLRPPGRTSLRLAQPPHKDEGGVEKEVVSGSLALPSFWGV